MKALSVPLAMCPRERSVPLQGLTRTASADKKCGGGKAPDNLCAKAATTVARCDHREQPSGRRGRGTPDRGAWGGAPMRLPA